MDRIEGLRAGLAEDADQADHPVDALERPGSHVLFDSADFPGTIPDFLALDRELVDERRGGPARQAPDPHQGLVPAVPGCRVGLARELDRRDGAARAQRPGEEADAAVNFYRGLVGLPNLTNDAGGNVDAMRAATGGSMNPGRKATRYLLTGLILCGDCGAALLSRPRNTISNSYARAHSGVVASWSYRETSRCRAANAETI